VWLCSRSWCHRRASPIPTAAQLLLTLTIVTARVNGSPLLPSVFNEDIDHAMLSKIYQSNQAETRYSPTVCIGCETKIISGNPDVQRRTNAFSKKLENHAAMVALYFMYYDFGRVHQTLRVTPAMESGISGHVWSIEEIVGLLN
jgi:hypothetical protein